MTDDARELTGRLIDAGLKVHRALGPGLPESVYEQCFARELELRGIVARRQIWLPIRYEGVELQAGYRLDLVVEGMVIVEVKAVETLSRLHQAQLLSYLRLSGLHVGLLMNFNVELFKDGLKRLVI